MPGVCGHRSLELHLEGLLSSLPLRVSGWGQRSEAVPLLRIFKVLDSFPSTTEKKNVFSDVVPASSPQTAP